jgi:hypothetical protein
MRHFAGSGLTGAMDSDTRAEQPYHAAQVRQIFAAANR